MSRILDIVPFLICIYFIKDAPEWAIAIGAFILLMIDKLFAAYTKAILKKIEDPRA